MSDSEEDVVLSEDEEETSEPEIDFGSDSEISDSEDGNEDDEKDDDDDDDDERQIYGSDKSQMVKECNNVIEVVSIPENERMTRSIASAEEVALALAHRSTEIANGSTRFADMPSSNPCDIAMLELLEGKCPYKLCRVINQTATKKYVEYWKMSTIGLPDFDTPEKRRVMDYIDRRNGTKKVAK